MLIANAPFLSRRSDNSWERSVERFSLLLAVWPKEIEGVSLEERRQEEVEQQDKQQIASTLDDSLTGSAKQPG